MDKQSKREAPRQIDDLPVEAEPADEVKGGVGPAGPDSPDARIQKKWLPAN